MDSVTRKEFDELKSKVDNMSKGTIKKKREPTDYNKFVGEECKKLRVKNPDMLHTEIFKLAVDKWKENKASENTETQQTSESTADPVPVISVPKSTKSKEKKTTKDTTKDL